MKYVGSAGLRDASGGNLTGNIALTFTVDGVGSSPAPGAKKSIYIPFAAKIIGWTIVADASGSIVFDVKKCAYGSFPGSLASIASTDKPTLSSVQNNQNLSLSVWTTAIAAGDVVEFSVVSASTLIWATVTLSLQKV